MNSSVSPGLSASSSTGTSATQGKPWVDSSGVFHEWHRLLVFVGSRLLGEFQLEWGAHPELAYRRSGVAYVCPHCGDTWGRIVDINSRGEQQCFEILRVACSRHPDQWNVPGSMLAGPLEAFVAHFPLAVLEREFEVHLKAYLKE